MWDVAFFATAVGILAEGAGLVNVDPLRFDSFLGEVEGTNTYLALGGLFLLSSVLAVIATFGSAFGATRRLETKRIEDYNRDRLDEEFG